MHTKAATGKSREQLYELRFNKAARGSQRNPYEETAYQRPADREVQAWWEQCQEWSLYYKCQVAPLVCVWFFGFFVVLFLLQIPS